MAEPRPRLEGRVPWGVSLLRVMAISAAVLMAVFCAAVVSMMSRMWLMACAREVTPRTAPRACRLRWWKMLEASMVVPLTPRGPGKW